MLQQNTRSSKFKIHLGYIQSKDKLFLSLALLSISNYIKAKICLTLWFESNYKTDHIIEENIKSDLIDQAWVWYRFYAKATWEIDGFPFLDFAFDYV